MVRRFPVTNKEVSDPSQAPCPMVLVAGLLVSVSSVIFYDTERLI
jgi:hypothetical protein